MLFEGFDYINKVKKLKEDYNKEIQRNKIIMEDLITWQFENKSQNIKRRRT
jgi:hypothetical protein